MTRCKKIPIQIKEGDYKKDKIKELEKCLNFLRQN